MKDKLNRRDFARATGAAAAVAAGLSIPSSQAEAQEKTTVSDSPELVPGMAAQGKGIKCYVESDYAPLKAALVGNPSAIMIPDPDTYEMANLFAHETDEFNAYLRKHKGTNLKDSDPKTWEKMAMESDALAKAYRDNGVRLIRNESRNSRGSHQLQLGLVEAEEHVALRPVGLRGHRPLPRPVDGGLDEPDGNRASRSDDRDLKERS